MTILYRESQALYFRSEITVTKQTYLAGRMHLLDQTRSADCVCDCLAGWGSQV